jgi:hypothetical protein
MPTLSVMRLHRHAQRGGAFGAAALQQVVQAGLFALERLAHQTQRDVEVFAVAEVGDVSPTIMPATTVSATELPPRRLKPCMSQQAASPAANRPFSVGTGRGVGAHAAHRVVLRRAHRDPVARRVDAQEVLADLLHLAQVLLDVVRAELGDVQPQVFAEAALHALALGDVLFHAPR